jgi:hypothetical protein
MATAKQWAKYTPEQRARSAKMSAVRELGKEASDEDIEFRQAEIIEQMNAETPPVTPSEPPGEPSPPSPEDVQAAEALAALQELAAKPVIEGPPPPKLTEASDGLMPEETILLDGKEFTTAELDALVDEESRKALARRDAARGKADDRPEDGSNPKANLDTAPSFHGVQPISQDTTPDPLAAKHEDGEVITVHFLEDGFTLLNRVWYRGQELTVVVGSPEWNATVDRRGRSALDLSEEEQMLTREKVYFRRGPWPYQKPKTAATEADYLEGLDPNDAEAVKAMEKRRARESRPQVPASR